MSEDNVVVMPVVSRIDSPPDRILRAALEMGLRDVVVIGYEADGREYFNSSIADGSKVLWLLERAKYGLLAVAGKWGARR